MFSSLASYFFGSTTSDTTPRNRAKGNPDTERHLQEAPAPREDTDEEHTIKVTPSTPSVTGTGIGSAKGGKRGKNKRGRNKRSDKKLVESGDDDKQAGAKGGDGGEQHQLKAAPSLTQLLTPNDSVDEDIDEDDWFIVERDDEEDSSPHTDSEEELSLSEVRPISPILPEAADNRGNSGAQRRRQLHIQPRSPYSGPRPQQHRNQAQKARHVGARGATLKASGLSPRRSHGGASAGPADSSSDGIQSAYLTAAGGDDSAHHDSDTHNTSGGSNISGVNCSMDESWFITPPPCFTSIGPIHMETSPFENLLIEHPSMSVYHSIRSAQEATESFVNLDLGVQESQRLQSRQAQEEIVAPGAPVAVAVAAVTAVRAVRAVRIAPAVRVAAAAPADRATVAVPRIARNPGIVRQGAGLRADRSHAALLRQIELEQKDLKNREQRERKKLSRNVMKRANDVRVTQYRGNMRCRSNMQHVLVASGAKNNRKCC